MEESCENVERWRREGLLNIKPDSLRFGEFPEGWDVVAALRRHVASLPHERIVDFGCGYGRLCGAFDPAKYLGVDINESAIEAARAGHPGRTFQTLSAIGALPPSDLYLAYTVFLHLDDAALKNVLREMAGSAQWIVIVEILGDAPLDRGDACRFRPHSVYHRTKQDYRNLLSAYDFSCWEEIRKTYHFYGTAEISLLVFRRDDPPPECLVLPHGLCNSGLQFDGIHDDGWVGGTFSVRLSYPARARFLALEGMLPGIDSAVSAGHFRVCIEGQAEQTCEVPLGTFQVRLPVETPVRRPWVTIHCGPLQRLPPPDGREVSVLLKSIGFID